MKTKKLTKKFEFPVHSGRCNLTEFRNTMSENCVKFTFRNVKNLGRIMNGVIENGTMGRLYNAKAVQIYYKIFGNLFYMLFI